MPEPIRMPLGKRSDPAFNLANLLNHKKVSKIKHRSAITSRYNKILWWLERHAEAEGGKSRNAKRTVLRRTLPGFLKEAGWRHEEIPLLTDQLISGWGRAERWGCLESGKKQMRKGRSGLITQGRYSGQKLEIDHSVAVAWAPEVFNHLANLEPQPFEINRSKSARVEYRNLALARNFHSVGVLSGTSLSIVEAASHRGWTRRKPYEAEIRSIQASPVALHVSVPLDPLLLVAKIGDLQERLQEADQRWGKACEQAGMAQQHVAEAVVQTHNRASCLMREAEEDLAEAQRIDSGALRWQEVLDSLGQRIAAAAGQAEQMRAEATQARVRWLAQLEAARERKRLAEEQVAAAEAEVEAAEEALDEAREALAEAERELEKAADSTVCVGKDKDGNDLYEPVDTFPYEAAVSAAEELVEERESDYDAAQEDLAEAKADLEAAIQRVEACKRALNFAEAACLRGNDAVEQAAAARETHDRAVEEQARIGRFVAEAAKIAAAEHAEVEAMLQGVAEARKCSEEAGAYRILVDRTHESARRKTLQFNKEVTERVEMLRRFDAPLDWINT